MKNHKEFRKEKISNQLPDFLIEIAIMNIGNYTILLCIHNVKFDLK